MVEMKLDEALVDYRGEATPQAPNEEETDAAKLPRATSLVIDTSSKVTPAASEMIETSSSSTRPSSSAVFSSFSKFDNIKQRYLKKVRESPKKPDKQGDGQQPQEQVQQFPAHATGRKSPMYHK